MDNHSYPNTHLQHLHIQKNQVFDNLVKMAGPLLPLDAGQNMRLGHLANVSSVGRRSPGLISPSIISESN